MNLLDRLQAAVRELESEGHYAIAGTLYPVITDVALLEEHNYVLARFHAVQTNLARLKAGLDSYGFIQAAEQVDVIQRDLEAKLIVFSEGNPIDSVLDSYRLLHRVASHSAIASHEQELMARLEEIVSDETLSENDMIVQLKQQLLGVPSEDKKKILYVLEKEHNLTLPLDKIAQRAPDRSLPPTPEPDHRSPREVRKDQEECLSKAKALKDREKCLNPHPERAIKMHHSYPASPSIWSGWSYETPIPYQQQNQLNFWSLAGLKPFTKRHSNSE